MALRRYLAIAAALVALPVLVCAPVQAQSTAKTLDFDVELRPVGSDGYELPGDVTYGQGRLVGTTTWGRRAANVDWMCSHIATDGTGPVSDLVTFTRSDGAVLALAVSGWVTDGRLRGTVEIIGGRGAYRGATGTGTVVGRSGEARLSLTVTQGSGRAAPRHGIGC